MREVKFRGLRADGKDWVYGYLVDWRSVNGDCEIMDLSHAYEVIPETVGQYTGLTDKNGVDIYEGDIVNVPYNNIGDVTVRYYYDEARYNINRYSLNRLTIVGNIHESKIN